MLKKIYIKNYALINELDIELGHGFNVITGETGAGKSIVLGALGLLLGGRNDGKAQLIESAKCIIEGEFSIAKVIPQSVFEDLELDYAAETIIRREISEGGRSRLFVNDSPASAEAVKTLGAYLVDIHSQHDTIQLGSEVYQLGILDSFAENKALLSDYQPKFSERNRLQKVLSELKANSAEAERIFAFKAEQLKDLQAAKLEAGETDRLEQELSVLEHAEEIKVLLAENLSLIDTEQAGIAESLKGFSKNLLKLSEFNTAYKELYQRVEATRIELKDIGIEIAHKFEQTESDPISLEKKSSRLTELFALLKKYKVLNLDELIAYRDSLEAEIGGFNSSSAVIQETEAQLSAIEKELMHKAEDISNRRSKAALVFCTEVNKILVATQMPNAELSIRVNRTDKLANKGIDKVDFMFTANKGVSAKPLAQVASGGEFSRLMLAVKAVQALKSAMPTLIFDEIDTGISGQTTIEVTKVLKQLSFGHQIIAITHQPQLAAKAERHFRVQKDFFEGKTISKMTVLSEQQHLEAVAGMISGAQISSAAMESAKELINS